MKRIFAVIMLLFFAFTILHAQNETQNPDEKQTTELLKHLSERTAALPPDSAVGVHRAVLHYATKSGAHPLVLFKLNSKLADMYRLNANFGAALQCDLQSLRLAETLADEGLRGSASNSIGIDYYRMSENETALKYFTDGLTHRLKTTDTLSIADSWYNMAMVQDDLDRPQEMRENYRKALYLFGLKNSCDGAADVFNSMAGFFYKRYQFDSATYYINKGLEKYSECGNKEAYAFMSLNLASLLTVQKKYDQAIAIIQKGMEASKEIGALSQIRRGYKNLSETYQAKGDYKNAWDNRLQYEYFNDSVFNVEKTAAFQEIMTKYDTEKKERIIVQKQAEVELHNLRAQRAGNQRNLFIIIASLALLLLAVLFWLFFEKRRTAALLDKQNHELQQLNATKDKFFSIISHDLRSPVSSFGKITAALSANFDKVDKEQLKDYIGEMNRSANSIHSLLNNLLQWAMGQTGSLHPQPIALDLQEIASTALTEVQPQAFEKGIKLSLYGDEKCSIRADRMMMDTVLRNLLTNAIKFSGQSSEISIAYGKHQSTGMLSVTDAGPGMPEEDIGKLFRIEENVTKLGSQAAGKGAGLGLILCKELITLNHGNITAKNNDKGGMTFTVFVPLFS